MATAKAAASPEDQLKRFLYTGREDSLFVTGDPEYYMRYVPNNITSIPKILSSGNPRVLLNIIEKVHSEGFLSHPETLLLALSVAANKTTNEYFKSEIHNTVINIIKTTKDLFAFLKFHSKQTNKTFASSVLKVVKHYYAKADANELLDEVVQRKGYHAWTHKDIIKLAHCRFPTIESILVGRYVLFGLEAAKKTAEENESLRPMVEKLTKFQKLKRCEDEVKIVELVKDLKCYNLSVIPSFYHNYILIWDTILPELPLRELIAHLPKLYKLGFLKANTPFQDKVVENLTNVEKIQSSQLHPVEAFIGLRNFEKGGKALDPKHAAYLKEYQEEKKNDPSFKKDVNREPPKCPSIISSLHKVLQLSFSNPLSTGRRIMISIDVNEKMETPCITTKNVSALEAAVILTLSLLKVEKDVTVTVFTDNCKVTPISLDKGISFNAALAKIKQHKCTRLLPSAAIEWASNRKKPIDMFINIIHHHHWLHHLPREFRNKENPIDSLNKYRKKMALHNTKLITLISTTPHQSVADGSLGVLDVCGFSKEVPKVIDAFSRGLFY